MIEIGEQRRPLWLPAEYAPRISNRCGHIGTCHAGEPAEMLDRDAELPPDHLGNFLKRHRLVGDGVVYRLGGPMLQRKLE